MLAGGFLQTAYSLINAFWVGRFLGKGALAALTVSFPAVVVLFAVAGGLTLATNILIAQAAGAQDWQGVRRIVQTSVVLVLGTAAVLLAPGLLLAERLLIAMNAPAELLPMATGYMRVFLWTVPATFAIFLTSSMLRGIGDSRTPVLFQSISVLLNTVLDPILIFGLFGLPPLGLVGTAWGTVIAQAAGAVALLVYVQRKRLVITPDWLHLRPDAATAALLARIGLPSMVQQSVVSVSLMVIVSQVSRFGTDADAAFGAGLRLDSIAFLPAMTVGMAISSIAGQNIGAERFDRVRELFRWGVLLSATISGLIAAAAITIPHLLLQGFVKEPEVIAIGVGYVRIVGFTYVLYAVMFAANGVINGAGQTTATTLITMSALWGVRLPLALLLPRYTGSVTGIWWAMLGSVFAGMVASLLYYRSGRWQRRVVAAPQ
jgi:putative MATE family efflux protein